MAHKLDCVGVAQLAVFIFVCAWAICIYTCEVYPDELAIQRKAVACDATLPLCSVKHGSWLLWVRCLLQSNPLSKLEYQRYVHDRLYTLLPQYVKGQDHVVHGIQGLIEQHLRSPRQEPLVLHFAGDNGVGKTRSAEMISVALALRCSSPTPTHNFCRVGENTLEISGLGYEGLPSSDVRARLVSRILRHVRTHPDGVIIINEFSSFHPEHAQMLMPLLGRGGHFVEDPSISLGGLIVVLTTDFGQEGRTRGKSFREMRSFVESEFRSIYTAKSTSIVHSFPFPPIAVDVAREVMMLSAAEVYCMVVGQTARRGRVLAHTEHLRISDSAADFMLDSTKESLASENARAVTREVWRWVEPALWSIVAEVAEHDVEGQRILLDLVNGDLVAMPVHQWA